MKVEKIWMFSAIVWQQGIVTQPWWRDWGLPTELIIIIVALLTYGCPIQAIVHAFGLDERTVVASARLEGQALPAWKRARLGFLWEGEEQRERCVYV